MREFEYRGGGQGALRSLPGNRPDHTISLPPRCNIHIPSPGASTPNIPQFNFDVFYLTERVNFLQQYLAERLF